MPKILPNKDVYPVDFPEDEMLDSTFSESEVEYERDYSKIDLVDLIDQPAWKTILLDLVESEKMDPWDIDVIVLAEKYIKKINDLETNNLRVPANAILACAILVKTKSKYLKLSSLDEEEEEQKISPEQRALFLEELPDLVANRSFREGKISLDELVSSIEDIIHRTTPKKSASRVVPRMEINFDSVSIEEKMSSVFELIKQKVDSQGIVLFKDLILDENTDEIVDTFLPVLFLMNGGKLIAYQNEFFGDIFVQLIREPIPITPEAK
ncbi:MAG: segregation/condensation protein A [Candidatus Diapherotrites archaeon]|uniref:Segregation/condensation protein A n=1 Tax=Candidatus Iainarchaeum sp. TaxID=3101447 RepID=A0A7K4BZK8_9ARCH|nr:segregation/condensation protein A [Candidatus Diapherotrites archaeon]